MNEKLKDLADSLEIVSEEVRKSFSDLSAGQLNWKPYPEKWSIGQCLDHLLIGNREMVSQIELKLRGDGKSTFFEKLPLLPGIFGPLVVNAVSPGVARTPRWNAWTDAARQAFYEDARQRLPVRRVGESAEIAYAFIYFMKNSYATGNVLCVDGGGSLV